MEQKLPKKKINKKLATVALAGALAVGAFSAAPAFAGEHGNSCSSAGCNKKAEKSSCKAKSKCKGNSCKSKHSCKKNSCKSASSCKAKSSCKGNSCKAKSSCKAKDHSDNSTYND